MQIPNESAIPELPKDLPSVAQEPEVIEQEEVQEPTLFDVIQSFDERLKRIEHYLFGGN